MNNYKINFITNTITITKEFAKNANNLNSDEYKVLQQIKTDYPQMTVYQKTRRSPKKCNTNKGLTYENMERYINTYENANEIMQMFELVKEKSCVQKNRFLYVKTWFLKQFPDYSETPSFTISAKIIPLRPFEDNDEAV